MDLSIHVISDNQNGVVVTAKASTNQSLIFHPQPVSPKIDVGGGNRVRNGHQNFCCCVVDNSMVCTLNLNITPIILNFKFVMACCI